MAREGRRVSVAVVPAGGRAPEVGEATPSLRASARSCDLDADTAIDWVCDLKWLIGDDVLPVLGPLGGVRRDSLGLVVHGVLLHNDSVPLSPTASAELPETSPIR